MMMMIRFIQKICSGEIDMKDDNVLSPASYSLDEEWVKEYIEQFGEEPSFF